MACLNVHDVRQPKENQHIPLGSAKARRLLRLLGSRQGFRFESDWGKASNRAMRLTIVQVPVTDYAEAPTPLHTYHVTLPDHTQSLDYDDAKILAWPNRRVFYHLSYYALLPSPQHPSRKKTPTPVEDIWISRANGKHLREIGYVRQEEGPDAGTALYDLRWLPDGKRLSFEHNDALWTVRAP